MIHKSTSLKYEPSSEPLHISADAFPGQVLKAARVLYPFKACDVALGALLYADLPGGDCRLRAPMNPEP